MKWLYKLFIPKHEHRLMEIGDNATEVWSYSSKYQFLDKFGNGIAFFTYPDTKTICWFVVDRTQVEDEDSFRISYSLSNYLICIAEAQEKKDAKLRAADARTDYLRQLKKFDEIKKDTSKD